MILNNGKDCVSGKVEPLKICSVLGKYPLPDISAHVPIFPRVSVQVGRSRELYILKRPWVHAHDTMVCTIVETLSHEYLVLDLPIGRWPQLP